MELSNYVTKYDLKNARSVYTSKFAKKKLVNEYKIVVLTNNSDLDKEKATLAIKVELKAEKDKIVKVQECYWSCFGGESHL